MRHVLGLLVLTAIAAGCGGSKSSPTGPSDGAGPLVLAGSYSGSTSDSTGAGTMTWTVSQTGTSVTAPVTATSALNIVAFTGSLTGSLDGTTLSFTIAVPTGAIAGFPGCTATINGSATGVSATRISGTYSGTNSCSGPFTGGTFTLAKQ